MICSKCKKEFPDELKRKGIRKCPDCYKKMVKENNYQFYHNNQDREKARVKKRDKKLVNETNKRSRDKIRYTVLFHYSNGTMKCAKCGFNDERALTIDHVNGDGAEHRRKIGISKKDKRASGNIFYRWLKNNNFPNNPPLQVLCANCNTIKGTKRNEVS